MHRILESLRRFLAFLFDLFDPPPPPRPSDLARFECVPSVFNASERKLFDHLRRFTPEGFYVLAKVRMEDVVRAADRQDETVRYAGRRRVASRHFDFVLIDPRGRPALAIELDGPDHRRQSARDADAFKDRACEMAGLRLLRVPPGYRETRLEQHLRDALADPRP